MGASGSLVEAFAIIVNGLGLAAFVQNCRLSGVKKKRFRLTRQAIWRFVSFSFCYKRGYFFGLLKYGIASAFQFLYIRGTFFMFVER